MYATSISLRDDRVRETGHDSAKTIHSMKEITLPVISISKTYIYDWLIEGAVYESDRTVIPDSCHTLQRPSSEPLLHLTRQSGVHTRIEVRLDDPACNVRARLRVLRGSVDSEENSQLTQVRRTAKAYRVTTGTGCNVPRR